MINDFIIQAISGENILKIVLNGFFMKSEIELAIYLARIESFKLKPEFHVLMDSKNLRVAQKNFTLSFHKMKKILTLFGAGSLQFVEPDPIFAEQKYHTVGLYSYENEWFF